MEAGTRRGVRPECARLPQVLGTTGVPFCLVGPASELDARGIPHRGLFLLVEKRRA